MENKKKETSTLSILCLLILICTIPVAWVLHEYLLAPVIVVIGLMILRGFLMILPVGMDPIVFVKSYFTANTDE